MEQLPASASCGQAPSHCCPPRGAVAPLQGGAGTCIASCLEVPAHALAARCLTCGAQMLEMHQQDWHCHPTLRIHGPWRWCMAQQPGKPAVQQAATPSCKWRRVATPLWECMLPNSTLTSCSGARLDRQVLGTWLLVSSRRR